MKARGPWLLVWLMAATVVALLSALLLTKGDDGVDAADLLERAPEAVDEQGTAHMTMTVDSDALGVSIEGDGAVDFGSGAGWFTVDLLGRGIETRTDGAVLYVLPEGDDTWLAVRAGESALGSIGAGSTEVVAFVDLLRDGVEVEDEGTEEIDGQDTRHVRTVVDVADVPDLAQLAPDGKLPLDVWIGDDDLPVRIRATGETRGLDLVITVELTGWGDPLGADIPPEGATRDVEPEELAQIFGTPPG